MGADAYSIRPCEEDIHAIIKYKQSVGFECPSPEPSYTKPQPMKSGRTYPCVNRIRVLILYTPNALSAVGGNVSTVQNIADEAISQFNTCIYRSNISAEAFIVSAAPVQLYNFVEAQSAPDGSANAVQEDLNSFAASVGGLRSTYHADLVVMLTNGSHYGTVLGIAKSISSSPSADRAFSLVQITYATSSERVFAHEVGHIYGAHHTVGNEAQGAPSYAKAYQFGNWPNRRLTVVAEGGLTGDRYENFSNPSVSVAGHATGTQNNNNARRISENYQAIRNYDTWVPNTWVPNTLASFIDGPTSGSTGQYKTWEAWTSCGNGPFTYEWRTSLDGFNYSGIQGTGEYYSEYLPPLPFNASNYYYLWLRVNSADGQTSDSYLSVYLHNGPNPVRLSFESEFNAPLEWKETQPYMDFIHEEENSPKIIVYPNPSFGEIKVNISTERMDRNNQVVDLIDLNGRVVHKFGVGRSWDSYIEYSATLSGIVPGQYIIRCKEGDIFLTKKIHVSSHE